jgi:hypothetical protein
LSGRHDLEFFQEKSDKIFNEVSGGAEKRADKLLTESKFLVNGTTVLPGKEFGQVTAGGKDYENKKILLVPETLLFSFVARYLIIRRWMGFYFDHEVQQIGKSLGVPEWLSSIIKWPYWLIFSSFELTKRLSSYPLYFPFLIAEAVIGSGIFIAGIYSLPLIFLGDLIYSVWKRKLDFKGLRLHWAIFHQVVLRNASTQPVMGSHDSGVDAATLVKTDNPSAARLAITDPFEKINAYAIEIYSGITIVPDQVFSAMVGDDRARATVIPGLSPEERRRQIEPIWQRFISRYPEAGRLQAQEREELERRLFSDYQLLIAESILISGDLKNTLEHEWLDRFLKKNKALKEEFFHHSNQFHLILFS